MLLNIGFLILGILGAMSIFVYLIRELSGPRLFCRVAGEQCGQPIPLATAAGRIALAIGTTTPRNVEVLLVSVGARDDVELSSPDGQPCFSTDLHFPLAVEFRDPRTITRGYLHQLSVHYKAKAASFELRVKIVAAMRDEEQGFLLDMFAPRKTKSEHLAKFRIDPSLKLTIQQSGLAIRPGESVQALGKQAQEAVWAAADKEGSTLLVRELVKEEDDEAPQVTQQVTWP